MDKDTIIERKTYIVVGDKEQLLFPATNLYPSSDLYPKETTYLTNIVAGSMKLDKVLFDGDLKFGQLCSDKFEVTVFNITEDISGKAIYVQVWDENNNTVYPIFSGIIDSCKLDRIGDDRQLVAYDPGYYLRDKNVAEWWETFWGDITLETQHTLKELRESLCRAVGVTCEDVELPNDRLLFKKNATLTSASFGDILSMICELNCCFPHFNSSGVLEFIIINTESNEIDITQNYEGENSTFEEYITNPITGVNFYSSSDDLKWTVGDGDNAYIVSKNIFTYDKSTQELNTIGNTMRNYLAEFIYTPSNVKMILSDLSLNLGDYIDTGVKNFYIFKMSLSGSMFIEQELIAEGKENLGESTQKTNFDSIITNEKYRKIVDSVEEISTEIGTVETNLQNNYWTKTQTSTQISQTANSITQAYTQAISNAEGDMQEYTDNRITIDNSGIHLKAEKTSGSMSNTVTLDLGYELVGSSTRKAILKVNADNIELTASETIDLMSGGTINLTTENINISSTNFSVSTDGTITANNANITGTVTSNNFTGTGGSVGGITIDGDGLYSGSGNDTAGVGEYGSRYAFWAGGSLASASGTGTVPHFYVTHDGEVRVNDLYVSGGEIKLGTPDTQGIYTFQVDNDGNLYARNATFYGNAELYGDVHSIVTTQYGDNEALLSGAALKFTIRDGLEMMTISSAWYAGSAQGYRDGIQLAGDSDASFIGFGFEGGGTSTSGYSYDYTYSMILNNGLNPDSVEDPIIFYDDTTLYGKLSIVQKTSASSVTPCAIFNPINYQPASGGAYYYGLNVNPGVLTIGTNSVTSLPGNDWSEISIHKRTYIDELYSSWGNIYTIDSNNKKWPVYSSSALRTFTATFSTVMNNSWYSQEFTFHDAVVGSGDLIAVGNAVSSTREDIPLIVTTSALSTQGCTVVVSNITNTIYSNVVVRVLVIASGV